MEKALESLTKTATSSLEFDNFQIGGLQRKEDAEKAVKIAYLEGKIEVTIDGDERTKLTAELKDLIES